MKYNKILPAAASIIALTATIAFARDLRAAEEDDCFRIRVVARESVANADDYAANVLPVAIDSETGYVYQVEIQRGITTKVVSIDAYTGRILGRTEIPAKKS